MEATKTNGALQEYKVGIVGLGPVGMTLAVHLKEAGCDVVICDNDKIKINLIRKEGIKLEETINKHCFFNHVCTDIKELADYDLDCIIFSLKTYQTTSILRDAVSLKNDKICVVSAQNGLDAEQILSSVLVKRIL